VHHPVMKAYSLDLREKIVAAVGRGMLKAQAARTFGVGATSVKRYVKLAEEGREASYSGQSTRQEGQARWERGEAAGGGSARPPSRHL
jgi:transposase